MTGEKFKRKNRISLYEKFEGRYGYEDFKEQIICNSITCLWVCTYTYRQRWNGIGVLWNDCYSVILCKRELDYLR